MCRRRRIMLAVAQHAWTGGKA
ncbi:hypothetical protein CBM2615_A20066 [Cupriavidus taiwanensis]|uniref:Uncharacterized protein n=1 Tax=Cupriavidus taiwanensis TaxID=164546 RepID=A0A375E178_9BURK|nr:hypothetical protein CBM2610_A30013 [Cupriavidus taiwanensis]SOZ51394.1 hypothetical protein CBM2615_A20066 [Cupriavidus taiwanensis]SOZ53283.1 hypothetical protein CBM2614_A20065 [Cupriavidus taiwanensis]SOZ55067.1 hypothetical protein CBM2613_A20067 [Cupriavidus taiwanensis]SPA05399.1 hypothetical protein CBM2625_A20068 [Cupriavidus taiwanensis]